MLKGEQDMYIYKYLFRLGPSYSALSGETGL